MIKKRFKWNYDACYEVAKGCNKIIEFKKKNQVAYNVARKEGWIKDYNWFVPTKELRHAPRPNRKKWTFEKCFELAKTCNTLAEFEHKYNACACISRKYGWINFFDWLKRATERFNPNGDNVYAYIFSNEHTVYVGRTIHTNRRDLNHRKSSASPVFRFSKKNGINIPQMTILESGLTIREGLKKEDYYRKKYENEGWNVLNVGKTGIGSGSIGTLSKKWTKKSCREESKKYSTLKEFKKQNESAYSVATRNGWTKEYTWLKRLKRENGYWTKERCMEEAKKYKNKNHFEKGCPSAYSKAYLMGWLRDFNWEDARPRPLTYQEVYDIAKRYKKLTDFRKEEPRVLDYALRHKWLNSFTWLTKRDVSKKIVQQYDKSMNHVATFDSIKEACDVTGLSRSGISNCCRGVLKTSQGFIWKFSEII